MLAGGRRRSNAPGTGCGVLNARVAPAELPELPRQTPVARRGASLCTRGEGGSRSLRVLLQRVARRTTGPRGAECTHAARMRFARGAAAVALLVLLGGAQASAAKVSAHLSLPRCRHNGWRGARCAAARRDACSRRERQHTRALSRVHAPHTCPRFSGSRPRAPAAACCAGTARGGDAAEHAARGRRAVCSRRKVPDRPQLQYMRQLLVRWKAFRQKRLGRLRRLRSGRHASTHTRRGAQRAWLVRRRLCAGGTDVRLFGAPAERQLHGCVRARTLLTPLYARGAYARASQQVGQSPDDPALPRQVLPAP